MKTSKLSFAEGFLGIDAQKNKDNPFKVFDWDKAAKIIREELEKDKDLIAEAGLEGDWNYTSGTIFKNGESIDSEYTYLCSNWAIPTLIINNEKEFECWTYQKLSRFNSDSKWDEKSLEILKNGI